MGIIRKRAIWSAGLAVTMAATAAISAAPGAASKEAYPDVDFNKTLEKMFDGEGGEGGLGYKVAGNKVTAPILSAAQLEKAIPGNTLRKNFHYALHLAADGAVSGWTREWDEVDRGLCKSYGYNDGLNRDPSGACWKDRATKISGRWTLKQNRVCLPDVFKGKGDSNGCYRMVIFMNNIVLLGDDNVIVGKEMFLVKGEVLNVEWF